MLSCYRPGLHADATTGIALFFIQVCGVERLAKLVNLACYNRDITGCTRRNSWGSRKTVLGASHADITRAGVKLSWPSHNTMCWLAQTSLS